MLLCAKYSCCGLLLHVVLATGLPAWECWEPVQSAQWGQAHCCESGATPVRGADSGDCVRGPSEYQKCIVLCKGCILA